MRTTGTGGQTRARSANNGGTIAAITAKPVIINKDTVSNLSQTVFTLKPQTSQRTGESPATKYHLHVIYFIAGQKAKKRGRGHSPSPYAIIRLCD
jgi:hypothetical protein